MQSDRVGGASFPTSGKQRRVIWAATFVGLGLFLVFVGAVSWFASHPCLALPSGPPPCMFLSDWFSFVYTIAGLALLAFGATILILDRQSSQSRSRMKILNLRVAVILIVLATPLLLISVNPF